MMKKLFFCTFLLSSFFLLQAKEKITTFQIKKSDYEIIEIPSQFEGKRVHTSPGAHGWIWGVINESSQVLLLLDNLNQSSHDRYSPAYFNSKTHSIVCGPVKGGQPTDLNDNGFVCGTLGYFPQYSFIWSTKDNSVEYLETVLVRILNNNSLITDDGFEINEDGSRKKLSGQYYRNANKDGIYPDEERIHSFESRIGRGLVAPILCNARQELVINEIVAYHVEIDGAIKGLKLPMGIRSQSHACSMNDNGIIVGSATALFANGQKRELATVWFKNDVFVLNDIFGGNYEVVRSINNRGDMLVHGEYKTYVFLKKQKQPSK